MLSLRGYDDPIVGDHIAVGHDPVVEKAVFQEDLQAAVAQNPVDFRVAPASSRYSSPAYHDPHRLRKINLAVLLRQVDPVRACRRDWRMTLVRGLRFRIHPLPFSFRYIGPMRGARVRKPWRVRRPCPLVLCTARRL